MRLLVTGANGYIGTALLKQALAAGHEVIAAARQPAASAEYHPYDLTNFAQFMLPENIDAVVHLAANTTHPSASEVQAATHLLQQAKAQNAVFIFLSSQAATANARTPYGQIKWQIEQHVLAEGGVVIKPGMVYGGQARGLFGQLERLCRLPLVPAPYPSAYVQPVHVDEVCAMVLSRPAAGLHTIAGAPVTFQSFLKTIAHHRLGKSLYIVPVPIRPVITLLRLFPPTRGIATRLQSLISLQPLPVTSSMRPLEEGLTGTSQKLFEREANRMFRLLLHISPGPALVGHYVRACEQMHLLPLGYVSRWQVTMQDIPLLAPFTRALPHADAIRTRRNMVLLIAESTTGDTSAFIQKRPLSVAQIIWKIFCIGAREKLRILLAIVLLPVMRMRS